LHADFSGELSLIPANYYRKRKHRESELALAGTLSISPFRDSRGFLMIRVYDEAGNVIETHDHVGDFKDW
jgi:hypothetical protein